MRFTLYCKETLEKRLIFNDNYIPTLYDLRSLEHFDFRQHPKTIHKKLPQCQISIRMDGILKNNVLP